MDSHETLKTPCPNCKGEVVLEEREGAPYIPSRFIMCKNCKRSFGLVEWGLLQKSIFATILKENNFSEEEVEILWRALPHDDFGIYHEFDEIKIQKEVAHNIAKLKQYCTQNEKTMHRDISKWEVPDGKIPC